MLWQGKHFPIHRIKPCQMDWQKLVVLEKCILLKRKLVISLKNFFTNNFIIDTFVFVIAIISVKTTMVIIYTLCKHNKLRALVTSLALQQVKEVKAE